MQVAQVSRPRAGAQAVKGLRAFILFTGSGPVLLVSSYRDATDPRLIGKLRDRGITKFIAYEVPIDAVDAVYDATLRLVASDLAAEEDARVLDFNGHRIFASFSFSDLGRAITWGDAPLPS